MATSQEETHERTLHDKKRDNCFDFNKAKWTWNPSPSLRVHEHRATRESFALEDAR